MNATDLSKADFATLLELAEAKFEQWNLKEVLPDWDRRIEDLERQNLPRAARALRTMEIGGEMLASQIRQRVQFYAELAHESRNPELLSEARLDEVRQRILDSVDFGLAALKMNIERKFPSPFGPPESGLPIPERYDRLKGNLLAVINAEVGVLEAEGRAGKHLGESLPGTAFQRAEASRGTLSKTHKTCLGRNVDRLRKECGWSFDEVAKKTGLDKKLILGHVNEGKGAHPNTIKIYSDAFTKELKRAVTVAELES